MALFKICRGKEANLPSTLTNGYAYFCTDTTNFYIDHLNASDTLVRSKISANYADKLRYVKDGSTIDIDPSTILTDSNYETKIGTVTTSKNGLMSKTDKIKLDGIPEGTSIEINTNKVTSLSISSTDTQYPSAKAVYDAINNADYIPVAGGEFNFQNPIGYNNVSGNAWVFHSTSSKVTDPYGEEVIYDIGIAGNTVLACSHTDTIQDYRALYMRPEQVQVLDNSIAGDHRHGYLTPYRLVFQRYNNGYKNFNINAETDRTVICNDQKLIDFNQTRLENLGTPIEANDAVNKKYVDDYIASMTNGIKLIDQVNGYNYIVSMRNGTLVSTCAAQSISITTNPTKMSYMDGDHLNSAGMVVTATCEDGTTREITGFTCDNYVAVNNPVFVISYTEGGITYYTNLIVTVTAFDPAIVLTDFEYIDNGDGTYTITNWKETYNGEPSTEMIIPDNEHIIL